MKIKFKKNKILDDFIWIALLFQIMLGNLLGITNIVSLFLLVLIIFSCLRDGYYFAPMGIFPMLGFLCCIFIYPFYNFRKNGGDIYILLNNIFYIITPLALLLYMAKSCSIKPGYTREKLLSFCPLLNIYAIVNIFVMLGQLVLGRGRYGNQVEYWDSISGMFGKYGTPISTLYVVFVIVYDYLLIRYCKRKKIKTFVWIILAAYMVLSAFNDNKGFYLIFVLFVGFIWLVINYECAIKRNTVQRMIKFILKLIAGAGVCMGIFAILVRYTFVGEFYNKIIHEVLMGWEKTNLVQGSSERIGMISYALTSPSIRYSGAGLASTIWKKEYAFGFIHFGQSDIGVFIILGGIVFVGLLIFYMLTVFGSLLKRRLLSFAAVVIMILLGVYSQIFTDISMMGCVVLFMLTCWNARQWCLN